MEPTITCPNCKTAIRLTESLAAPLVESTRREYENLLAQKDSDVAKKEAKLKEREEAVQKEKLSIDEHIAEKLQIERIKIVEEESKKAKQILATDLDQKAKEIADLNEVIKQRNSKLVEAQKAQAELIRKQRELDDAKREFELTVEKRIQEGLDETREKSRKETEEQMKFKVMEKEQTIQSMQKQIEDLKRRSEQGSQQLQGEVQEIALENLLAGKFKQDTIEPVPKGVHGGDILHRVVGSNGQICGTILWESKRTKNWSDNWLAKLRDDQRTAKAEIAVMASQTLPKEVETFELIDGVWVTHPRYTIPLATILRNMIIEIAATRKASEGQQTKMEMIYQYLTSSQFRQRVQAIAESFSAMHYDLLKEKKAIMKQWEKREKQIECIMQSTVGMYGDMQGIVGKSLKEIEGMGLKALEAGE